MAFVATHKLRAPTLDPEPSVVLGVLAAAGACLLTGLLFVEGATYTLMMVIGLAVAGMIAVRPRYALYTLVAVILLSDLHLRNPNSPSGAMLFKSLAPQGILLTPAELIVAIGFVGLLARLVLDDEVSFRPGHLFVALLMLMAATALGIGIGMSRGADMMALRAETRGLFYLPIIYLLATHFLTKREHVNQLFWLFVVAANVMSAENIYRYFKYVRSSYELNLPASLAFSHESALFCAVALILLMSRLVWSKNVFSEWKTLLLMVLPMFALLVMRRRAGMVALDAGLIMLCAVLLKDNFKLFLIVVPVALVGLGLLLALTWNSPGGSGTFARSARSVTGEQTVSERDQSSDDYRKLENVNIRLNIQNDPIQGLGFGRQFAFYVPVADLSFWELWRYVPHNSILWFWMKAGIFGFVSLSTLFAVAITRSMQIMRGAQHATKAYAFAAGAMVVMFVLYSWVDLGMVTPRTVIFFGIVLGMIGALGYISPSEGPVDEAIS